MRHALAAIVLLAGAVVLQWPGAAIVAAETDLDAFMRQVLARRDDNWKKLQQYILDEREQVEVRGPAHISLWGERRDYTWYLRDGFFVRSPLKVNGVTISEADRRKYEADYLQRVQKRDQRASARRPFPELRRRQTYFVAAYAVTSIVTATTVNSGLVHSISTHLPM